MPLFIASLLYFLLLFGYCVLVDKGTIKLKQRITSIQKDEVEIPFRETVSRIVARCATDKVSPAARKWTTDEVVTVAERIISVPFHRELWASQICKESNYWYLAQSHTGPKGLGQVARETFLAALRDCGYGEAVPEDAFHPGLNLIASACYAEMLFKRFPYPEALAAYVTGPGVKNIRASTDEAKTYALEVMAVLESTKKGVK